MEKIIVRNIKTGVEKEIDKFIAADFLGTKEWEIATKETKKESKIFDIPKSGK